MIHFVTATPLSMQDFTAQSNLLEYCEQLDRLKRNSVEPHVVYDNTTGLCAVYNRMIDFLTPNLALDPEAIVVFVHHDVWHDDINLPRKLAGSRFDVIGLAGAGRFYMDSPVLWHKATHTLSGAVAHTAKDKIWMSTFGPFQKDCEAIDGVFIAVKLKRLVESGVRFDEQFDFHFYDLDFCMTARKAGLTIGTEPIWIIHRGLGGWDKPEWHENEKRFLKKWGEK